MSITVRGNPDADSARRSIPAWAGKPTRSGRMALVVPVHPRVGGETDDAIVTGRRFGRSIPAWAGKPRMNTLNRSWCRRSIPAWAGKPRDRTTRVRRCSGPSPRGRGNHGVVDGVYGAVAWVHPRVGGETPRLEPSPRTAGGPSPRGRGNRPGNCLEASGYRGPSPRGRGNPRITHDVLRSFMGPSPRGRGNPPPRRLLCDRRRVHPRVGGETFEHRASAGNLHRSIPAWAGKPALAIAARTLARSIPAWAGKPIKAVEHGLSEQGSIPAWAGKPVRRCSVELSQLAGGSIPAWAGKPRSNVVAGRITRSIPAWAGKPALPMSSSMARTVHPRVGGETSYHLRLRSQT